MFNRARDLAGRTYEPSALALQLRALLMQRHDSLLSEGDFEREIDRVGDTLPPWRVLNRQQTEAGGTRFVVRHVATGEVLDEWEFAPIFPTRLSFK